METQRRIPDRTASPENGTGYFGGTIKFINYNTLTDQIPAGTPITVKLTPKAQATYLDGTSATRQSGRKVVHHHSRCRTGLLNQYIPATHYTITVTSTQNGNKKAVEVGNGNPDWFYPLTGYYFKSEGGSGTLESGLISPNEHYFYIKQL